MSSFNPDVFMNTEVSEANSTTVTPVPEGTFLASIKSIKPRVLTDGRPTLNVGYIVDSDEAREVTGMAEPMVYQTIWLDVTEQGTLDFGKGKNVQLGRLRDAVQQNQSGKPWAPGMLVGAVLQVKVTHSIDKRDNETIQANVSSTLPM